VGIGSLWPVSSRAGVGAQLIPVSRLHQVPVPRHSVGVVIGRSGEMIKKIQNDAGVRIQFKQGQDHVDGLMGSSSSISCPP
jgi:predicted PilT family ATPase